MDSSSTQLSDLDGSKSVQIKVPVVATVTEKNEDGRISFVIEPPGPDQEQGMQYLRTFEMKMCSRSLCYYFLDLRFRTFF